MLYYQNVHYLTVQSILGSSAHLLLGLYTHLLYHLLVCHFFHLPQPLYLLLLHSQYHCLLSQYRSDVLIPSSIVTPSTLLRHLISKACTSLLCLSSRVHVSQYSSVSITVAFITLIFVAC